MNTSDAHAHAGDVRLLGKRQKRRRDASVACSVAVTQSARSQVVDYLIGGRSLSEHDPQFLGLWPVLGFGGLVAFRDAERVPLAQQNLRDGLDSRDSHPAIVSDDARTSA
jgi:hypothetical protein